MTPEVEFKAQEGYGVGVGDDEQGWAVDYQRGVIWHGSKTLYGPGKKICKAGDVVQVLLDLDSRVMRFGLNGQIFADAFVSILKNFSESRTRSKSGFIFRSTLKRKNCFLQYHSVNSRNV